MAIKPILFNFEMVKAILDGRKTQTRRIIKLTPGFSGRPVGESGNHDNPLGFMYPCGIKRPPCNKDDILWVRETWRPVKSIMHTYIHGEEVESGDWHNGFEYRAGGYNFPDGFEEIYDDFHLPEIRSEGKWRPSIHMPKEAARIFLKVKDVHIERLHDMDEEAAIAEGFENSPSETASLLERFATLWDKTIKHEELKTYGYHANPWVWVITFELCDNINYKTMIKLN